METRSRALLVVPAVVGQVEEAVAVERVDRAVGEPLRQAGDPGLDDRGQLPVLLLFEVVRLTADLEQDRAGAVERERASRLAGQIASYFPLSSGPSCG